MADRDTRLDAGLGERAGLTDARPVRIEVLKVTDSPDAAEWKLMSFGSEAAPDKSHIHDDIRVQYITLSVADLSPYLRRIRAHGIRLLGETPIPLGDGNYFALI